MSCWWKDTTIMHVFLLHRHMARNYDHLADFTIVLHPDVFEHDPWTFKWEICLHQNQFCRTVWRLDWWWTIYIDAFGRDFFLLEILTVLPSYLSSNIHSIFNMFLCSVGPSRRTLKFCVFHLWHSLIGLKFAFTTSFPCFWLPALQFNGLQVIHEVNPRTLRNVLLSLRVGTFRRAGNDEEWYKQLDLQSLGGLLVPCVATD